VNYRYVVCRRPSVCRLSACLSSVTFVHPTQAIEIFGNVSTPLAFGHPLGTLKSPEWKTREWKSRHYVGGNRGTVAPCHMQGWKSREKESMESEGFFL